jgi:glycogen phosphorylase
LGEEDRRKRELKDLYSKLEYLILPVSYTDRDSWIDLMKNSVCKVAYYFHSHRMMRRYATEAYL